MIGRAAFELKVAVSADKRAQLLDEIDWTGQLGDQQRKLAAAYRDAAGEAQRGAHLAQQFEAAGLKPGDRVVLFMHNHPRYLEVMFGAWWAGLVVVPINAKLHVREAQWIVDNAQASWAFVTRDVTTDTGGFEGRGVVVAIDAVVGQAPPHTP